MVKSGGEKGWYYFNLVVLVLLAGFRYRVGGDTLIYMSMFEEYPLLDELKYFDFETAQYNPLWYVINAISRSIYDDFFVFQFIHAIILNSIFFGFFRKYCPKFYFSAILLYYVAYYCYFNMEVLRESLGVSILLLATPFLLQKRWVPYYLLALVALAVHYSGLLLFLLPFLHFFKKPSWKLEILLLGIAFVCLSVINLPTLLLNLFGVNEQLVAVIEHYTEEQRNLTGMIVELMGYFPIFCCIWLRERNQITEKYDFTFLIMGTVVIYALAMQIGAFSRFVNYFAPFIVVYMVNTIYHVLYLNLRKYQVSYLALLMCLVVYGFNVSYYYLRDMSEYYPNTRYGAIFLPYYTIFDKKIDNNRENFIENYREVQILF